MQLFNRKDKLSRRELRHINYCISRQTKSRQVTQYHFGRGLLNDVDFRETILAKLSKRKDFKLDVNEYNSIRDLLRNQNDNKRLNERIIDKCLIFLK